MAKIKAKKNTFDRILDVFAWVSFTIAVMLALAVFFSSFSGKDNGRDIFGYKMLIVESDSMSKSQISKDEPIFFNKDDLIFIKEVSDVSTIKVGDVITFVSYNPESRGKTLSHKVRSIKTNVNGDILGFETYGINTGVSDQAIVDPSTVVGVYVGKSPFLGKMFTYFKTPAGYFTSILIPCVLLIIFFSIKVGKMIAKKEILDKYDADFVALRNKILEIEKNKGEGLMQTDLQAMEIQNTTSEEGQQTEIEQMVGYAQPAVQTSNCNDNTALEIMAKTLGSTIDSLTRTLDALATVVGKPVDTLARSIEILATATIKPTVVERVIEKPVVQTIVKENVEEQTKEQEIDEIAVTEASAKQEEQPPVVEPVIQVEESTTGGIFSEFKQREKVAFSKKLLSLDKSVKEYFSEIHNELVAFKKVNYRISFKGITYRVGRKALAKMIVRGKTLKLHLALNVEDFSRTVFFQQDMGGVKAYEDVPFAVKIKSDRAKNNALKLVNTLAENNSLKKDDEFKKENILKELKQY